MTGISHGRNRFLLAHLGPALLAAALLPAPMTTVVDSTISNWFFDPATITFPLRDNAAFEIVTHQWAKYLIVLIGCAAFAAFLLSHIIPSLVARRRLLLFLALALTLAPAAVSLLKSGSPRHCPYDLLEYGGYATRLGSFDAPPPGQPPGRCFPGGHASAGFALLAFYFVGLQLDNRRLARIGLWGGLAAGMLFGMARVAQGAHFLSHNLWSALVCWLVILSLYCAVIGPRAAMTAWVRKPGQPPVAAPRSSSGPG